MSLDIKKVINHLCSKVVSHDASISNLTSSINSVNTTLAGLTDFYYPVGSYYETSDTTFNPNTAWGGTWVLETAGLVHVSGGTGYSVTGANSNNGSGEKDGGSADAIVVEHNHSVNAITSGVMSANASHYHRPSTVAELFLTTGASTDIGVNGTARAWPSSSSSGVNFIYRISGSGGISERQYTETINIDHRHSVGAHETNGTGTSGVNANMQPYVNVNRWHRTA